MATLAEAQAQVVALYPAAAFGALEDHPRIGSGASIMRWLAVDDNKPVNGNIVVIGEDAYVSVPEPVSTFLQDMTVWITDYANRPWTMVLRVQSLDPVFNTGLILASTEDPKEPETEATVDFHVVKYTSGAWESRLVTNVVPALG